MGVARVPTVSSFLCYFELQTGGLILGWMDVGVYGLTLAFLVINLLSGMSIVGSEQLNKFAVLGLVIDTVVQLVLMFLFLGISLVFVKGVKDRSPKMCLPFVILVGLQSGVSLLDGLVFLNVWMIFLAFIKVYCFIVVYSLYQLLNYGDEQSQAAYIAHKSANSEGYEQYYEPDGYNNIDNNEMAGGYQTTEFKGP